MRNRNRQTEVTERYTGTEEQSEAMRLIVLAAGVEIRNNFIRGK